MVGEACIYWHKYWQTYLDSGLVGGPVKSPPTSVSSRSRSAFNSTASRLASESLSLKHTSVPSYSKRRALSIHLRQYIQMYSPQADVL